MSLKSDISFIARTLGGAIRQILGETFRILADTLLYRKQEPPAPPDPPVRVETPAVHSRKAVRASSRQIFSHNPPPEVEQPEKPVKIRDRSSYNPKNHNGYKIAAIGTLRTLLSNDVRLSRLSAPALHKINQDSTDSTIRTACKTMVKDGILATEYDNDVRSDVYWILNRELAVGHLTELESVTPKLPTSEEGGESESSLN